FVAETRTCRATARAPGSATSLLVGIGVPVLYSLALDHCSARPSVSCGSPSGGPNNGHLPAAALPVVLLVTLERPGQRELTELVPDHGLGHEHGYVLAPVVYGDRVPEHLGDDRRTPRPGLDDVLGVPLVLHFHLLEQVVVDERTLLQAARHCPIPASGWRSEERRVG